MNHAVEQEIVADAKEQAYLLYVEVEPQPDEDIEEIFFKQNSLCYVGSDGKVAFDITPPISIGDTVYRGEEWVEEYALINGEKTPVFLKKRLMSKPINGKFDWQSPQTMPIELADKTFKVLGIEVELMPRHVASPDKPLADCDYRDLDEAWFWKYSLEDK